MAGWGWPLIRHFDRLDALRPRLLRVSLSGTAGTLAAMGPQAPEVRRGLAEALVPEIAPDPDAMARNLDGGLGLAHAEAQSFALAAHMPRPEAQDTVKALSREALETRSPLADLVARDWPGIDRAALFDPARQLGEAPRQARDFAEAAIGI